jgi:hypothetical protein
MSFLKKRRKNTKADGSSDQPDEHRVAAFSITGTYGIKTLTEPENAAVE